MTQPVVGPTLAAVAGLVLLTQPSLTGQGAVLGVFQWQLQPYCNVLTVTVVQLGAQYHVDGTDDGCGAARKASVVGLAFPNPDGSVGFGLTTVTAPLATPIHLDATIAITSLSGRWRDSGGNTGDFVFTPGAGSGGSVRPIPAGGIAPGTITSAQIATGAIDARHLAPGAITSAAIAEAAAGFGTCPAGEYLRGIRPNGTMICEPIGTVASAVVIDSVGNVGQTSSLAIGVDGRPVISYYDDTNDDLKVAVCGTAACTGTPTIRTLDSVGQVGAYTSVAIGLDGRPIVSYWDLTSGNLKVAVCATPDCTGAPTLNVLDTVGAVGSYAYSSIAIGADGRPVVSYYDVTNGNLKVAVCATTVCIGVPTRTTVDSVGDVGEYASLAIGAGGRPVISYYDRTNGNLKVAMCATPVCTGPATITILDSAGDVGRYSSIRVGGNGRPVVSYYDASNFDLKVAACTTVDCSGSPVLVAVDTLGVVGSDTSLAIDSDGRPVISYFDTTNADLKVAVCSDAVCSGTPTVTTVDSTGYVGVYTSLAIGLDRRPVVSYSEEITYNLKVAKCNSRTCL